MPSLHERARELYTQYFGNALGDDVERPDYVDRYLTKAIELVVSLAQEAVPKPPEGTYKDDYTTGLTDGLNSAKETLLALSKLR